MEYPNSVPGVNLNAGKFSNGNPLAALPASLIPAEWMNAVTDELKAVIVAGGLTPNEANLTQLRDAILNIAKGTEDYKNSVRVASTTAINLSAPGANIDGVAMVVGDRFLEKDNATLANRGIYIWNGAAVAATRAPDADTGAELNSGAIIPVEEGTANGNTNWQLTTDGTVTIGTTALTFSNINAITNAVMPGAVAYYAMSAAPTGWLKANGAAISRATYSTLFAAIGSIYGAGDGTTTFNLPDLRGEFLRGFDDARGIDSGRAMGSYQRGTLVAADFDGTAGFSTTAGAAPAQPSTDRSLVGLDAPVLADYLSTTNLGFGALTSTNLSMAASSSNSGVSRPRNVALLACIKF